VDAPSFRPNPFIVRYGDTQLELQPHTYCWSGGSSGGCADGVEDDPPVIGSPKEIFVFVPIRQFDQLVVTPESKEGVIDQASGAESRLLVDGWWQVRLTGPAGTYRVSIFATDSSADSGGSGDMVADIMWTIDTDR